MSVLRDLSRVLAVRIRIEIRDGMFIQSFLRFGQAQAGFDAWRTKYRQKQKAGKSLPLVALLLPGINRACGLQRRIEQLRIIERPRAYADAHDGKLPNSLRELNIPVSNNPVDIKPFNYALKDDEATLRTDDGTRFRIQYRIRIVR